MSLHLSMAVRAVKTDADAPTAVGATEDCCTHLVSLLSQPDLPQLLLFGAVIKARTSCRHGVLNRPQSSPPLGVNGCQLLPL